jgi:hypothetical protein
MRKFIGTSWITDDANYSLSIIEELAEIDNEFGKHFNSPTYNSSKVDWRRIIPSVLPENLRYIAYSKQDELHIDDLFQSYYKATGLDEIKLKRKLKFMNLI